MASTDSQHHVSRYRWVVLAAFMFINMMVQILWICFAPIARDAAAFMSVKKEDIDLLANLFMIIYIPVAIPAAWAIDKLGIHKAVGFGAVLAAVFAMLRVFAPQNYTFALLGTIGLSVAQPFVLGAMTKLAALWFPQKARATIIGVIFFGLFGGVAIGMALTPALVESWGISGMVTIYGVLTLAAGVLFVVFARSAPKIPVDPESSLVRALILDGLKSMMRDRDVYVLIFLILLGSAVVNGILTLIDSFGGEKHFSTDQGVVLTAIMLVAGIVGSVVLPALSDGLRRRKAILICAGLMGGLVTIAMAFVNDFVPEVIFAALVGFSLSGVIPVAYQYGAEITHPTPEGTSNGILGLALQAAGFLIAGMDVLKPALGNSIMPALVGIGILLTFCACLLFGVRESPEIRN